MPCHAMCYVKPCQHHAIAWQGRKQRGQHKWRNCRAKQAEVERIAAAEQQADQQLVEAAMRKDAQEEAADKQAKAERKAEQLRYRSVHIRLLTRLQVDADATPAHQIMCSCDGNTCITCPQVCVQKQRQQIDAPCAALESSVILFAL